MSANPPAGFDRADWKAAAHNRWAFRHTADFLPTARVRAAAKPRALVHRPHKLDGLRIAAPGEGAPLDWDGFLAATSATSALVVHSGAVVDARYPPPTAPDDRHMLFSVTKSVTGLVALALIERGALDPPRRARDYVPEFEGTAFGEAEVGALLAMRDGAPFDETYADPAADIHRYSKGYWGDAPGGAFEAIRRTRAGAGAPGRFAYRTPVADVVGFVLQRAAQATLADLVSELVWAPIGAAHDAHFVLDTAGVEIAGAGLNAVPADLARLALTLMEGGDGMLREATVDALFAGGDVAAFAVAGYAARPGWSYRDLWWNGGGGVIAALGVHGQRLYVDRTRGLALVRTGAQPTPDNRPYDALHEAALGALAREFSG